MIKFKRNISNYKAVVVFLLTVVVLASICLQLSMGYIVRYSPYDDNLYIAVAEGLITNNDFGLYSNHPLLKIEFFPVILFVINYLKFDYIYLKIFGFNFAILLIATGLYKKTENRNLSVYIIFILILNPVIFSNEWAHLTREPLCLILDLIMIGILLNIRSTKLSIGNLISMAIFLLIFSISIYLREEEILRYAIYILCIMAFSEKINKKSIILMVISIILSIIMINIYKSFVIRKYETNSYHQLSNGPYLEFINNLRRIRVNGNDNEENRYVEIKWKSLEYLKAKSKNFNAIYDRIPLPNKNSISCIKLGVCNEWADIFMIFWIINATNESGLANNYIGTEKIYQNLSNEIDYLCTTSNEIKCGKKDSGLMPSIKKIWLPAFFEELFNIASLIIKSNLTRYEKSDVGNQNLSDKYKYVIGKNVINENEILLNSIKNKELHLIHKYIYILITLASITLIILRVIKYGNIKYTVSEKIMGIYLIYNLIKILALAYIAIYAGEYEIRLFMNMLMYLPVCGGVIYFRLRELNLIKKRMAIL